MTKRLLVVLTLMVQCRPSADRVVDAGAPEVPPIASSVANAMIDAAPPRHNPTAREIVDAWNLAHTKHDLTALTSLYAPHVKFYGQTLTNVECVAAKKGAFAKAPDYAQAIRDVVVGRDGVVTFTKTSTSGGKSNDYPAMLVITGGLVTAETDKITEANLAAQASKSAMWCYDDGALFPPNDKVIPPYRISGAEAYRRARLTKHFKDEENSHRPKFIDYGEITCPTSCDRATRQCGYDLRLEDHSPEALDNPEPHSILIEWVYVDAVDGTFWFEGSGGWKSEPLPP